jgi:DNA-binding MarR family transcriptional regulator
LHLVTQLGVRAGRLAEISRGCGLTQQAAGQIAEQLSSQNYLRQTPDPHDRRAKQLSLTRRGRGLLRCLKRLSDATNADLAARIGKRELADFEADCSRLLLALLPDLDEGAHAPLWMHLALLASHVERTLMEMDKARGYEALKMSFSQVLMYTSPHGTLINDLARINGVSKQAISQVVKQVERLGYVTRRQHPGDRRSTMIFLTDAGLRLIRDTLDSIGRIESDFAGVLGSRRARRFAETAKRLHDVLEAGTPAGNGQRRASSAESALQNMLERVYLESDEPLRARLFSRAGSRARLSAAALKVLDGLELQLPAGKF